MEIKVIGFDADDTLWLNMTYFDEIEKAYCELLKEYITPDKLGEILFKTELKNMEIYGFGVKSFMLSMIETALVVSEYKVPNKTIEEIINMGKHLLYRPVVLLEGVEQVLSVLSKKYKLIVATKGDLVDQESKLKRSGLAEYFHHVEIMSDKTEDNYKELLKHLEINPENFLMVGNSLKSDIVPVINIGGNGVHVPFHITWQHELMEEGKINNSEKFIEINNIINLLEVV
ncbi:MAG: HAD family hydrolase [bacterium]